MSAPAFLGFDVGTSSSKGVLVGLGGEVLRSSVRTHAVDRPAPGQVEMDPRTWWQEFLSVAAELTADLRTLGVAVAAVGVSGMGPCVALTDAAGESVRPAVLYGVDTRAGEQIAALDAELGTEEILRVGGSVLTSQAAGPKIAWIAQHEPAAYSRAERLFMPASYLAFRLTGEYVLDHHSASQSTPLYDAPGEQWHTTWARRVAPGIVLPSLRWPGEVAGLTTQEVAGIPAGTPVITGTIDAWSEAVSVGAQEPGDLMLMYGTTMFLIATVPTPLRSRTMWGTVGAFPGTHNLAGGMATSGAVTAWLRDLTASDYTTLLAEAGRSGPGAGGLLMLPYLAGERTPIQDPDARGVVVGLTLTHTRGDLYRAALEATAFGVRHNVESLRHSGAAVGRVVAVGGGTQGDLWTQIVSDVTGLEQTIPSVTVGASYGAARLAAQAHGDTDTATWNPPARAVHPDAAQASLYDAFYADYLDLYPATRAVAHRMARHQRRGTPCSPDQ